MHAETLGFLGLTHQLYQRCLLQRPILSRLADGFVLRCFQYLSNNAWLRSLLITAAKLEASDQRSSRTRWSLHSNNYAPSRYHTNCLTYLLITYDFVMCGLYHHPLLAAKEIGVLALHKKQDSGHLFAQVSTGA